MCELCKSKESTIRKLIQVNLPNSYCPSCGQPLHSEFKKEDTMRLLFNVVPKRYEILAENKDGLQKTFEIEAESITVAKSRLPDGFEIVKAKQTVHEDAMHQNRQIPQK